MCVNKKNIPLKKGHFCPYVTFTIRSNDIYDWKETKREKEVVIFAFLSLGLFSKINLRVIATPISM